MWKGRLDPHGYGVFDVDAKPHRAHRWILEYHLGRKLRGDEVARHMCHTKPCVRIEHLAPGSRADNAQDEIKRGRRRRSVHEDCGHPLTSSAKAKCRQENGVKQPVRFGFTPHERFMLDVDTTSDPNGCHLWIGRKNQAGYGRFGVDGTLKLAHRWALEQKLGRKLGPEEVCRHACDVRACVRQDHLEPGTRLENARDTVERGQHYNAHRTHCKRGHEFNEENTYIAPTHGKRSCRACALIRNPRKGPKPERTHCKHGHELTPENTMIRASTGTRDCRECGRIRTRESQRRKRNKLLAGESPVYTLTHCKNGHEFTEANTYITPASGSRQCLECKRERRRKRKP
ncbi:HNH endonuclease [Streptomyces koyangensis]